ncbi:MAG: PEP-CTERM sorting domain-containing protein [Armatimonadetes bacterium]|nr:PEP-CTERM sorting domain-containing protein [Armatimonadota bacterium]
MKSVSNPFVARIALSALLTLLVGASAHAQFARVASSQELPTKSFSYPSLNNSGLVAFGMADAGQTSVVSGIYKATSPGSYTTVATKATAEFARPSSSMAFPQINDSGEVAFYCVRPDQRVGIYKATDSSAYTTIATSVLPDTFTPFYRPYIANNGDVAFKGFLGDNDIRSPRITGLYKGNGGALTTIADNSNDNFYTLGTSYGFNNNGQMAYNRAPSYAAFRSNGSTETLIANANQSPAPFQSIRSVSLNDSGLVAFSSLPLGVPQSYTGIYTATGAGTFSTVIQLDNSTFQTEEAIPININNNNAVAYWATTRASLGNANGIYLALSGQAPTRIIGRGDALFGSTVTGISNEFDLNDNNEIAFAYFLANGERGVARFSGAGTVAVPEPSTFALLAGALSIATVIVRRRKK